MSKLVFYNTEVGDSTYSATAAKKDKYVSTGMVSGYYELGVYNASNCSNVSGGICLKAEDLASVKLSFTPPTGVIGYLDEAPADAVGAYNFNTSLTNVFTHDLPLAGE